MTAMSNQARGVAALLVVAAAAAPLAACGGTGTGGAVRTDITARMQTLQAPIQACYASALKANRRLRGLMVVNFRAAPSTGQFDQITVDRDEVGDSSLRACVIQQVQALKLATPQRTAVSVAYPIRFAPTK